MTDDEIKAIALRALELHGETGAPLLMCANAAALEHLVLYGDSDAPQPVGILGCSPIETLRRD